MRIEDRGWMIEIGLRSGGAEDPEVPSRRNRRNENFGLLQRKLWTYSNENFGFIALIANEER